MVNLDELEDLLRKGEKEKAYELTKEDRGISADILMNEGIHFGIVGEYSISISYFELAEKIAENNEIKEVAREMLAVAYYNCGVAYGELNKHEEAIEDYNKAIELDPNLAQAYSNRGNAHYKLKQYEKAIEGYNKAIELNPKDAMAYSNRGAAYRELKQYEKAIKDYNVAIELNPTLAGAYNNRGDIYSKLNQHEKAIENYNKAIELNPKYDEAYYNRGVTYHELKQYEKAIKDYNKAIELNPKYVEAYNNRGGTYHELNQYEKAIEDYNKAIELNPKYVEAYYNRGDTYHELNQREKEIEDYNKAIELDPNFTMAYNNRGVAYCELNQYEKAIEDYNVAIELNPNLDKAYNNRGLAYRELNQYEKAIKDCNTAIELNPKYAAAYSSRGNAYCELNQYEKAIKDYNVAIELNPNFADAYNNRGLAYRELNQHEKAIEDLAKAIALNPNLAQPYANRGFSYFKRNEDLAKAIEDFKHVRELSEGKEKERMFGVIEWAKARKEMNIKHWDKFRKYMNEAREIFEEIDDSLSHSFDAFIKLSFLDEKLDNTLNIPDPIKALEEIEAALKNPPKIEVLIEPERTIFAARISSFSILREFIGSMASIAEKTDLEGVKKALAKLREESKEVEKLFESVNFVKGKTAIVDIQEIISSVKQEIGIIELAANKKQKALEILKEYWSRLSSAIKVMNGISTREIEEITLRREIKEILKSELRGGFAETKEIFTEGIAKLSGEHEVILEKIYETENILIQKDAVKARYRIEIKAPLISSLSPISPKIIVDIPMGKLTEKQIEEKAEEIVYKIKDLSGKVKKEFFKAIERIPRIGKKLLNRLKKTEG